MVVSVRPAATTVCVIGVAEAVVKLVSAAIVAPMEYVPGSSALVIHVAAPAVTVTAPQPAMVLLAPPLGVAVKVTLPVGTMPLLGVTVAVKVTGMFTVDGEPLVPREIPGVAWVMDSVLLFEAVK